MLPLMKEMNLCLTTLSCRDYYMGLCRLFASSSCGLVVVVLISRWFVVMIWCCE
jgi:hypothetical protein